MDNLTIDSIHAFDSNGFFPTCTACVVERPDATSAVVEIVSLEGDIQPIGCPDVGARIGLHLVDGEIVARREQSVDCDDEYGVVRDKQECVVFVAAI